MKLWVSLLRAFEVVLIRLKHKGDLWEVEANEETVRVLKNRRTHADVKWVDVRKLTLTQHDRFTYELVCLFLVDNKGRAILLHELMGGYLVFCRMADKLFPGFEACVDAFTGRGIGKWSANEPLTVDLILGSSVALPPELLPSQSQAESSR